MAINHMVWIKFRAGTDASRIQAHLDGLRSLAARVPGILELHIGENFTDRANGCTHGLCVILTDKAALQAYAVHPAHVQVASALRQDAEVLALDYEFDAPR
jgi:hypothetical protein